MQVHSDQTTKAFVCTTCNKAFFQKYDLNRHEQTHTGAKLFKCDTCHKDFTQSGHLARHIKGVHQNSNKRKQVTANVINDDDSDIDRADDSDTEEPAAQPSPLKKNHSSRSVHVSPLPVPVPAPAPAPSAHVLPLAAPAMAQATATTAPAEPSAHYLDSMNLTCDEQLAADLSSENLLFCDKSLLSPARYEDAPEGNDGLGAPEADDNNEHLGIDLLVDFRAADFNYTESDVISDSE